MDQAVSTFSQQNAPVTSYLTLGDGDFTFSLDLARYLSQQQQSRSSSMDDGCNDSPATAILVATGIDSLKELTEKYKDTPFILDQLCQLQSPKLGISIHHGVNAIVHDPINKNNDPNGNVPPKTKADHVIFHHPHLGTEDAVLHGQFLAHIFHSATHYWMNDNDGVFHLTLVQGQFERWKCQAAAARHGLVLLHQECFTPPPVPNSTYNYRRHQTGRSFATRRPASKSITYTFGRENNEKRLSPPCLPWKGQPSPIELSMTIVKEKAKENDDDSIHLPCPFCDKMFREERSRKCHIRDRHPNGDVHCSTQEPGKKRSRDVGDAVFECTKCTDASGGRRVFQSDDALQAHVRAKHNGMHTYIAPDWSIAKKNSLKQNSMMSDSFHSVQPSASPRGIEDMECKICGATIWSSTLSDHLLSFVPSTECTLYQCSFCSKSFREERARLQHENFCTIRVQT
ncbi:protein of unknown function DUF2431 containing protein [Nitzschia inconspicua]|uniref:C2H2-type domain-containing protein n=1 Tax=Nitzschia inconspicua TaxID=303405 RepID=A0A9K3KJL4_9STRA|nr:protein of unknown function DUF2431 containing protein [Nitzschia inconspicua]